MSDEFKKGDKVEWNYAGNPVPGVVEEKLTEETELKGHKVKASEENPEYLVKSEKSGKEAAHKPDALKRRD